MCVDQRSVISIINDLILLFLLSKSDRDEDKRISAVPEMTNREWKRFMQKGARTTVY